VGNIFNPDFKAFLKCFNEAEVKYVLVGGDSVISKDLNDPENL